MIDVDSVNSKLKKLSNFQLDSISVSSCFRVVSFKLSFNGQGKTNIKLIDVIYSNFSRELDTDDDCIYVGEVWIDLLSGEHMNEFLAKQGYGFSRISNSRNVHDDVNMILFHIEGAIVGDFVCKNLDIESTCIGDSRSDSELSN